MSTDNPLPPPPPPFISPSTRTVPVRADIALKVVIGSVIGLILGFGTCGMGAALNASSKGVSQALVPIGLIFFIVSILGMIVGVVWLVIAGIIMIFRN